MKVVLIKGKAHIAPHDHALGEGSNVLKITLVLQATALAHVIVTNARFLISWGRKMKIGEEKRAHISLLPLTIAKGHNIVIETLIIQSLSSPAKLATLKSPPHITKNTKRTLYMTVKATAINIKKITQNPCKPVNIISKIKSFE